MNSSNIRPAYRLLDWARQSGVGKTKLYEEIAAGRLKVFKIGRSTMVSGEDAAAWLNSYRNQPTSRAT